MGIEGGRKLIYVGKLNNYDDKTSWLVIDPPNGDKILSVADIPLKLQRPPEGLSKLVFTRATVWGSTIYFIGGEENEKAEELRDPSWSPLEIYSKEVFSFDTKSNTWGKANRLTPMKSPRLPRAVVAVAGKIFVFGFRDVYRNRTNREEWAEFYDIVKNEWSPIKAPPEGIRCNRDIVSVAVYEELILLWIAGVGVCSLDTNTRLWNVDPYPELSKGPVWSRIVAVVGDYMFWHHYDTIYAYDFINNQRIALLSLEEYLNSYWKIIFKPDYGIYTHLVHVGDDRLCLVHGDHCEVNLIYCYSFLIKKDPGLKLEFEEKMACPADCFTIEHVLLV